MSAIDKILALVARPRRVKPGQWMAACPCCESRKGTPLAITETSDGRILMHAFCGCGTDDVLGRLGLSITDLFNEPLFHHGSRTEMRVPTGEVLAALTHEATVLAMAAADIARGLTPSRQTQERIATAAARITNAADYCNAR